MIKTLRLLRMLIAALILSTVLLLPVLNVEAHKEKKAPQAADDSPRSWLFMREPLAAPTPLPSSEVTGDDGNPPAEHPTAPNASVEVYLPLIESRSQEAPPPDVLNPVNSFRGYYRWRNQEVVPNGEPAFDAYNRYTWIDLETSRGNYDFSQIEADVADAASRGQKFGLRIRAMKDASSGGIYIPSYLSNCGWYHGDTFIPDWNSSCFLDNAENLIQALGQRYDNDPRIAWIDIGIYGNWGEWALPAGIYDYAPPGIQPATDDSLFRIVDVHLNAFPTVRKVMMAKTNEYAVAHALSASDQVGWRVDCLGKPGYFDFDTDPNYDISWPYMQDRWQTAPVITEFCAPTSNGMDLSYQTAEEQVVEWHISMVGNGNTEDWDNLRDEQQNNLQALGKKAGYRYQVNGVAIPSVLVQGQGFEVRSVWHNLGVAPHYERVLVKFKLYEPNNGPAVWEGESGIDLRAVLPGSAYTQMDAFQLPGNIPPGTYELRVKVVDPASIRRPLRLAIEGLEPNGSYYLKDVTIR